MRQALTQADKTYCEEILNHPAVRSHVWPGDFFLEAPIDSMDFWIFDGGLIAVENMGEGEYMAVSAFLPSARGLNAVVSHRKLMDEYFFHRDMLEAYGTIEKSNMPSIGLQDGMKSLIWDCSGRKVSQMSWIQWALKSRTSRDAGRVFVCDNISEDESRVLGAFTICAGHGWVGKGFAQYNKFARLSGGGELIPIDTRNGLFKINDTLIRVPVG